MQDTYEFRIDKAVSDGTIEYFDIDQNYKIISGGEKLRKDDLIDLSKLAKENKLYDKSINFLKEATK